jgi:hypothetical protein
MIGDRVASAASRTPCSDSRFQLSKYPSAYRCSRACWRSSSIAVSGMLRGDWSIGVLECWRTGGLGLGLADWAALLYSVTPELLQLLTPGKSIVQGSQKPRRGDQAWPPSYILQLLTPGTILSQVEKIGAGLLTLETAFY